MTTRSFINSFFRRFRYGEHGNPMRDWTVLLSLFAIVLSGVVVWNAWMFDTVANGRMIGSQATSTQPFFDRATLNTINHIFSDRFAEEEKYETGVYRFADPSQ